MTETPAPVDVARLEAAVSDLLGVCSEAGYRDAVSTLVTAAPSLLAAYRERNELRVIVEEDAQKIDRLHRAWLAVDALCEAARPCQILADCDEHRTVTVAALRAALSGGETDD